MGIKKIIKWEITDFIFYGKSNIYFFVGNRRAFVVDGIAQNISIVSFENVDDLKLNIQVRKKKLSFPTK